MVTMANMRMLQQPQQKEEAEGLHAGDIITILSGLGPEAGTRIKKSFS